MSDNLHEKLDLTAPGLLEVLSHLCQYEGRRLPIAEDGSFAKGSWEWTLHRVERQWCLVKVYNPREVSERTGEVTIFVPGVHENTAVGLPLALSRMIDSLIRRAEDEVKKNIRTAIGATGR